VVLGVKRYILNAGGSEEILRILEAQAADTTPDQSEQQKSIETEIVSVDRKIHHLIELAESGIEMGEGKKKLLVLKKGRDRLAGKKKSHRGVSGFKENASRLGWKDRKVFQ
jgi:hypothetical protein